MNLGYHSMYGDPASIAIPHRMSSNGSTRPGQSRHRQLLIRDTYRELRRWVPHQRIPVLGTYSEPGLQIPHQRPPSTREVKIPTDLPHQICQWQEVRMYLR